MSIRTKVASHAAWVALAVVAFAPWASTAAQTQAPAQKQDAEYTALNKQYLTDPPISTELVDHLPASDNVPTRWWSGWIFDLRPGPRRWAGAAVARGARGAVVEPPVAPALRSRARRVAPCGSAGGILCRSRYNFTADTLTPAFFATSASVRTPTSERWGSILEPRGRPRGLLFSVAIGLSSFERGT